METTAKDFIECKHNQCLRIPCNQKKLPIFFSPYGQGILPSYASVTLHVFTYFLTKLHTSQSPAFVK